MNRRSFVHAAGAIALGIKINPEPKSFVFQVNEYEWYLARSFDEAVSLCMEYTGLDKETAVDYDNCNNQEPLGKKWLSKLVYENDDGTRSTFLDRYKEMIADGVRSGFFAADMG